jgi:hypothetical protein
MSRMNIKPPLPERDCRRSSGFKQRQRREL